MTRDSGTLDMPNVGTTHTHTHNRLTALFRDYPAKPVPER